MSQPGDTNSFDLLRGMIEKDYPERLSLFDTCAHRFRSLHPDDDIFQFFVATGFLALVMRAVPEKVAAMLREHDMATKQAVEQINQEADGKLAQLERAGHLAVQLAGQAQRLEIAGSDAVTRLEAATAAHEQAVIRIEARQKNDVMFWLGVLLLAALLGFALGVFYGHYR